MCIDAALDIYRQQRAASAPEAVSLERHEKEKNEFIEAVREGKKR